MTAQNDTANWIAKEIALVDGYEFERLSAGERLSYRGLADRILRHTEHAMAAQGESLGRALKDHWNLPA